MFLFYVFMALVFIALVCVFISEAISSSYHNQAHRIEIERRLKRENKKREEE